MHDIFALAAHDVANPDLVTRVWHSSKFHQVRSATKSKGSFGSKVIRLVGTAGRAVVGCIPLPLAGGLIATCERAIENKIRSKIHESKRDKQTANLHTHVKFALKELSVDELDRFRAKLDFAVTSLNQVVANHNANFEKYAEAGKPCQVFWDLALELAVAERRAEKLLEACVKLHTLMEMTMFMGHKYYSGLDLTFSPADPRGQIAANSILGIKTLVYSQYRDFVMSEFDRAKNYNPNQGPGDISNVGQQLSANALNIQKHASGVKSAYATAQQNVLTPTNIAQPLMPGHRGNAGLQGANAKDYVDEYHHACGRWCCFEDLKDPSATWDTFKNGLSKIANVVSVVSPTDLVSGITLPSGGGKTAFNWGEN